MKEKKKQEAKEEVLMSMSMLPRSKDDVFGFEQHGRTKSQDSQIRGLWKLVTGDEGKRKEIGDPNPWAMETGNWRRR